MSFQREKTNVTLFAFCFSLTVTSNILVVTVSALAGSQLSPDPAQATLPYSLQYLSATLGTLMAAYSMKRFGMKTGFVIGLGLGSLGAGLSVLALQLQSFGLFCLASLLYGFMLGFAPYFRFAAAEVASEAFRPKAISLVLAGGVVGAVLGPTLAKYSVAALQAPFAGTYGLVVFLPLMAMVLLFFVRPPQLTEQVEEGEIRPWGHFFGQSRFLLAVAAAVLGSGSMVFLMVGSTLAMKGVSIEFHFIATVIQWHVLGMFVPSFFTGSLIERWGIYPVLALGAVMNLGAALVNLWGQELWNFMVSLTLLGVGWNFLMVGGTSLLTQCYRPSEQARIQAFNEFSTLGINATASLGSGVLLHQMGWGFLNLLILPQMLLILVLLAFLGLRNRSRSLGEDSRPEASLLE